MIYKGIEIVSHIVHPKTGELMPGSTKGVVRYFVYVDYDEGGIPFDTLDEAKAFVDNLHLGDNPSLDEARADEMVHHKASVTQLLALAKRQPMRFAIDEDDKLHIGNAHHFTHDELSDDPGSHKIEGMISKSEKTNKLHFHADDRRDYDPIPSHKVISTLEASGAIYKNRLSGDRNYRDVKL